MASISETRTRAFCQSIGRSDDAMGFHGSVTASAEADVNAAVFGAPVSYAWGRFVGCFLGNSQKWGTFAYTQSLISPGVISQVESKYKTAIGSSQVTGATSYTVHSAQGVSVKEKNFKFSRTPELNYHKDLIVKTVAADVTSKNFSGPAITERDCNTYLIASNVTKVALGVLAVGGSLYVLNKNRS